VKGQDIWPPDTPRLDSVSIYDNVSGYTIVTWFPSDSADVVGYIIYRNVNTVWETVDTVPAPATSYIDYGAQAHYHAEQYRIAAIDEEGNKSLMTDGNEYHNTMYVFPYQETENCQPLLRIHWNKYQYWPEGVREYQIYQSINFNSYSLLATNYGDVNGYKHFQILDTTSYCFYIKAISNQNKTSTSNITCIYVDYPNIPAFVNIDYATVTSGSRVEISCSMDNTAQVRNFRLERAARGSSNFTTVATVNNYSQSTWKYTDNPGIYNEWVYRTIATDACGNVLQPSNTATNIVAYGYGDRELNHFLSWNHYRFFNGDIDRYELYRVVDNGSPALIASLSDTLYTDNVADFADGKSFGKFTYFVIAHESNVPPGKGFTSLSSQLEINEFARVFIPNTFSPNSDTLNGVFKPIASFVRQDSYEFAVYSRWGEKLFYTRDVNKGWDGKHKGKPMKQDMYVYIVKYSSYDGDVKEKSGYIYIYYPLAD
jgi:gliding motility-associated-like protein